MKTNLFKLAVTCALALLFLASSAKAQDNDGCGQATLKGDYAFTVSGTFWVGPGNSIAVQREGVAMTHFDGAGNLWQVDFVLSSPNAPAPPGVPPTDPVTGFHIDEKGTYTVHQDCTGTFTINNPPLVNKLTGATTPGAIIVVRFLLSAPSTPLSPHLRLPAPAKQFPPSSAARATSSVEFAKSGIELRLAEQLRVQPKEDGRSARSRLVEALRPSLGPVVNTATPERRGV